jgi:hypothetical protein
VYVEDIVEWGGAGYYVMGIGDKALYGAHGIKEVYLPSSITNIGIAAFAHCASLEGIEIPEAYDPDPDSNTAGQLLSVSVGDMAFLHCLSLPSISFMGDVDRIGELAFAQCNNLREIYFYGEPPTEIGGGAFHGAGKDNGWKLKIYYKANAVNAQEFLNLFNENRPGNVNNVFWSDPNVSVDPRANNPTTVLEAF